MFKEILLKNPIQQIKLWKCLYLKSYKQKYFLLVKRVDTIKLLLT